jgi:hypothetical protein
MSSRMTRCWTLKLDGREIPDRWHVHIAESLPHLQSLLLRDRWYEQGDGDLSIDDISAKSLALWLHECRKP